MKEEYERLILKGEKNQHELDRIKRDIHHKTLEKDIHKEEL